MKQELTPEKFDLIAKLIRSRMPVCVAARLVLVDGKTIAAAADEIGLTQQSVSNTVSRFRQTDAAIREAYSRRKPA